MKTYTGNGDLSRSWAEPSPHTSAPSLIIPDDDAPEWVHRLVESGQRLVVGHHWMVNGRVCKYPPAWTPSQPIHAGQNASGYMCITITPGDVVSEVRVILTPEYVVRHIPGCGVIGPERTSSKRGVRASYTVTVLREGIYK